MSPVVAETTLVPKTSGGRVTQSGQVTVGASIGGAVLMVVTEKMATKALSQRASKGRMKGIRAREDLSG